ncbi:MAG: GPR1/FUN34/YaaH family transporter [Gammaproteobacteria bacterium]
MNSKSVILTTIGFMCLGITVGINDLATAGWINGTSGFGDAAVFALGSVTLGVIAILALLHGTRVIDGIIFFGGAAFFWTVHQLGADAGGVNAAAGWFYLLWALFFFYLWLASFKSGWARMLLLLAAWIALLCDALVGWTGAVAFAYIDGYVGLYFALVALYLSAAEIINHGYNRTVLQTGSKSS